MSSSSSALLYYCALRGIPTAQQEERGRSKKTLTTTTAQIVTNPTTPTTGIRVVCISDTHNRHEELEIPKGDILLHAGDFTNRGTLEEISNFAAWLKALPFKHKIVIPGNHELSLDTEFYHKHWSSWHSSMQSSEDAIALLHSCCTYLQHGLIEVEGIRIFASAFQPRQVCSLLLASS
jgi:hypothetical protein